MADVENRTFKDKEEVYNKKINPQPVPPVNIGIDVADEFFDNIISQGVAGKVDITQINSFSQLSNNREQLYEVLDIMAQDSTISAMLEIYAEDATETNEEGRIIWCQSDDPDVTRYITFLLDSLNVDKNAYKYAYSLCKYGDLYLKLFRKSDIENKLLDNLSEEDRRLNEDLQNIDSIQYAMAESLEEDVDESNEKLNEDVKIKAYKRSDKFENYIEMVPNPAEMFELTRFGKSWAYIKTNSMVLNTQNKDLMTMQSMMYKFHKNDVEIYDAASFVHAALEDDVSRQSEEVQIFTGDDESTGVNYTVRRGTSILQNAYKIWRELMLLENALLLNRITKSSILRVIEVEVADMAKENVGPHLQRIKTLVEQKSSINTGNSLTEYTNPGPMENNIYVPTKGGVGAISTQQIGGDVNIRDIADIDYFKNKFYSAIKIPKQFLGDTEDSTGFNGGTSLSIISSRYAKTVKRIQSALVQAITDAINILLLARGQKSYINKFTLHMCPPVTQEELDKRENTSNKIRITDDIMRMTEGIEDPVIKLKLLKTLLSEAIYDQDVINLIQEAIDNLEQQPEEEDLGELGGDEFDDFDFGGGGSASAGIGDGVVGGGTEDLPDSEAPDEAGGGEEALPSPEDLGGVDFTEM